MSDKPTPAVDDVFEMYDLRVEVVESERPAIMHVKKGDYFDVIGGRLVFPKDRPEFSLYGLLAVLPFIPAKQRPTHPNDWMTSDCLIASTDPACGAVPGWMSRATRRRPASHSSASEMSSCSKPAADSLRFSSSPSGQASAWM